MVVSDDTPKVYRATTCVKSRSVNYVELLLAGAAVERSWEGELTEGRGREVGAGRRENDGK